MSGEHFAATTEVMEVEHAPTKPKPRHARETRPPPPIADSRVPDDVQMGSEAPVISEDTEMEATGTPPVQSADTEMKESETDTTPAEPKRSKTIVLTKKLSAEQKELIMSMNAAEYPQHISTRSAESPVIEHIPADDIFALKGTDLLGWGSNKWSKRAKRMTVLGFPAKKTLVGKHVDVTLDQAQAFELEQTQRQGKKGKAKANAPQVTKPTAPLKKGHLVDAVKVTWHLDSQFPHIEVTVRAEEKTNRLISTRIFAEHLTLRYDRDNKIGHTSTDGFDPAIYRQAAFGAEQPEVSILERINALNSHTVQELALNLHKHPGRPLRTWEGISDVQLAAIRSKPNLNSVRDQLIVHLDQASDVSLMDYATRLFSICKYIGNFWWYRGCYLMAGLEWNAIDRVDLPKVDFKPPRWMVQKWRFTVFNEGKEDESYADPEPWAWLSFRLPTGYPNANESAFLLKLAVEEERKYQLRELKGLVQSDGEHWFQARFRSLGKENKRFAVSVYLGMKEEQMRANKVKMPGPGTRITLGVNRAAEGQDLDIVMLSGSIVDDPTQPNASFVCVCVQQGFKGLGEIGGGRYQVFVSYIVDDVPHQRQLKAIQNLQMCTTIDKGPDLKRFILGCEPIAKQPNSLSANTSDEDKRKALAVLDDTDPAPDQEQKAALIDTIESETGKTILQGPPGTGKTRTENPRSPGHCRAIRFLIWPALSISIIYAVAKSKGSGRLLSEDPMLWFILILTPIGPPATKLVTMVQVSDAGVEDERRIAKILTISYMVSPILAFTVVGALKASEAAI